MYTRAVHKQYVGVEQKLELNLNYCIVDWYICIHSFNKTRDMVTYKYTILLLHFFEQKQAISSTNLIQNL